MESLSVIVPVYNEEQTVLDVLRLVGGQKLDVELEVLVVDDGSTDKTASLLESNPELYSKLISLPSNAGKGAAVKAGLQAATGDYVLIQDADLEYDPEEYARLVRPVARFGAELVLGSRMSSPDFTRVSYFWHKVGNRAITFLFNILYNTTFTDIYSGYLMFRRNLVDPDRLTAEGWEQQAEILARAVRNAESVYEVPINYHGRTYKEGKKIRGTDTIPVIAKIVTERFRPKGRL